MATREWADISSNNAWFDPAAYAASGRLVVGNKATEGEGYVNPTWAARTRGAHRHRVAVVHYHFARADEGGHPVAEAEHFLSVAHLLLRPQDRVCLDLERPGALRPSQLADWANAFSRTVRQHAGLTPVLYSDAGFFGLVGRRILLRGQRPWIATYGPRLAVPGWLRPWWAWQHTDGRVGTGPFFTPGVGRCDSSTLSLRAFLGIRAARLRWR